MSSFVLIIDLIFGFGFILLPSIIQLICKKKNKKVPWILDTPLSVKITIGSMILFTIFFSLNN